MRDFIPTIKRQTRTASGPSFTRMFPGSSRGEQEGEQGQRRYSPLVTDDRRSDWYQSLSRPHGWPPQVDVRSRFLAPTMRSASVVDRSTPPRCSRNQFCRSGRRGRRPCARNSRALSVLPSRFKTSWTGAFRHNLARRELGLTWNLLRCTARAYIQHAR